MLADFITHNREEIVARYRTKSGDSSLRLPLDAGNEFTDLMMLDELLRALRFGSTQDTNDGDTIHHRDNDVLKQRMTVPPSAQYGDICQSITELALETNAEINVDEFVTLDRCADEATARAIADFVSERGQTAHATIGGASERLRVFQHEVQNLVDTAILSVGVLRTGKVGVEGSTGCLLHRTLIQLRSLADRIDGDAD